MLQCALIRFSLILAVMVLVMNCSLSAYAGQVSLVGGLGGAFFQNTVDDGTWRQDKVQTPNTRLFDRAWKVGLEYRINPRWSVQSHYFDWGENVTKSLFASDDDYYGGRCHSGPGPSCPASYNRVVDRMKGVDVTVSRYWKVNEVMELYLTGGGAMTFHELKWAGGDGVYGPTRFYGNIPMLVVGGGLCYNTMFCWDTNFYMGTLSMNSGCIGGGQTECGYPLAKQVVETAALVKIPFK